MKKRIVRLVLGGALVAGAASFGQPAQAWTCGQYEEVCSTVCSHAYAVCSRLH